MEIIKRSTNMKSHEHVECEMPVMKSIYLRHIVHTYQNFGLQKTIYIVMEYVHGGDLFDFVAQHECLTEKKGSESMR